MSMSPSYIPEPYATIIKRLGNAYDTGFFMGEACVCLAVILKEAAEEQGHQAQIKLVMEDSRFLHHAFIEITLDDTVFDLDIKGRGAAERGMKNLDGIAHIKSFRDRLANESHTGYLIHVANDLANAKDHQGKPGDKDPSQSFAFIRKLAFDYA